MSAEDSKIERVEPEGIRLRDVYWFAYELALRSFGPKHVKDAVRLFIEPCNYWRNLEVPEVMNQLQPHPSEAILDIGSPKLASLFLCYRRGVNVLATDLFPYFFEEYAHYFRSLGAPPAGASYRMEVQDARHLEYPPSSFDKVYAISVLEHIEGDGDSQAVREIARVLRPGGWCTLTVPFDLHYRETHIQHELYYKKPQEGQAVFYQRHYDPDTLRSRLIEPSRLRLRTLRHYGERIAFERFYSSLHRYLRLPFSLTGPLFTKALLHRLQPDSLSSVKAAMLTLVKD